MRFVLGPLVLLFWIFIIIASGAGWNPFPFKWDFSNTGAFGDSFGPLSTIMAAAAAVCAFLAYDTQRKELDRLKDRETQEDIRQNKAEFERTFFQLLQSFRSIIAMTDIQKGTTVRQAHDAFKSILRYFDSERNHNGDEISWSSTAEYYKNDLNHYFRTLYHLIKFIDNSSVRDKYFYTSVARSGLSDSELILLALNCAYGEGREKFKPLLEKYTFLNNLSTKTKIDYGIGNLFKVSAFTK